MNQTTAKDIFEQVSKTKLVKLKLSVLNKAIAYAHIRAEWSLAEPETHLELDIPRRIAHNALIDSINILARNMHQNKEDIQWYKQLKDNRIAIAEFACWVHNFLTLSA